MKLVLATRNRGKLDEFREILDLDLNFILLDQFPDIPEVIEDRKTFAGNAIKKAIEISKITNLPSIADDSGLEIDALDGDPGVRSARYAGENSTADQLIAKVLDQLKNVELDQRTARFRCAIAMIDNGVIEVVEGACEGQIIFEPRGKHGFGYDPIFVPNGYDLTFAELGLEIKNRISHRAIALKRLKSVIT